MTYNPDRASEVDAVRMGYLADVAAGLGPDATDLPVGESLGVDKLAAHAAAAIVGQRHRLANNELALNGFFGHFTPACLRALQAAHDIALTQGEFTPADEGSLATMGDGLKNIKDYLLPFVLPDDAPMPGDVPPLGLGARLRVKGVGHGGKDAYVSGVWDPNSILSFNTDWPQYSEGFRAPVLLDPTTYTTEEFAGLDTERADGYAQQVVDTWCSIQGREIGNPSFIGRPLVVRAVAVLPVLPADVANKFAVDFLPELSKPSNDKAENIPRAYDVRMLVRGDENVGADYVKFDFGDCKPIFADRDGKRAPLTVSRAQAVPDGLPESMDDLGLTPRSQGAVALYLAPHIVDDRPRPRLSVPMSGGNHGSMFGGGFKTNAFKGGLGGASVSTGQGSSWIGSGRHAQDGLGRIVRGHNDRPIIFSLQLLTLE
jgi:hypothetical protein